ncbi:MAG: hypothetical protein RIE59_02460 [Imperialibacter sp.]
MRYSANQTFKNTSFLYMKYKKAHLTAEEQNAMITWMSEKCKLE